MPAARSLSEPEMLQLRQEAARHTGGSLRPWVQSVARLHGVSDATIYRAIQGATPRARKRRSDAGSIRDADFAASLEIIKAMIVQTQCTPEYALDWVNTHRAKAGQPELEVSLATIRRHLDAAGFSSLDRDVDRRIHRRWEAPYANYLWQMDATTAAQYYLRTGGAVGIKSRVSTSKNKEDTTTKLYLLLIIDDHSRVKFGQFTTSMTARAWINVLVAAMLSGSFGRLVRESILRRGGALPDIYSQLPAERADQVVWPACGVPERLYTDNDSAVKALEWVSLMQALGIEHKKTERSTEEWINAQAKGKVERGIQTVQRFEAFTKAQPFTSLDRMNGVFAEFLLHENNVVRRSLGGQASFERWIATAVVRACPEAEVIRASSASEAEARVSAALTIRVNFGSRHGSRTFQLPMRAPFVDLDRTQKLQIRFWREDPSLVEVLVDGQAHTITTLYQPDVAGEYKAAPKPKAVEEREKALATDITAYKPVVHEVWGHKNAKDPRVYAIQPAATQHPLTIAALAPRMVRRGMAIDRLQAQGLFARPPAPDHLAQLNAVLAGRGELSEAELDQFIIALRTDADATIAAPKLRIA
jgi:hypothetical protein